MSDDGYIYLRIVDQLLAGNGPVFSRGERVEAATSPLWVGLLALSKSVLRPVPSPWLAVTLGLVLSLTGLALAQWGAFRLWQRPRLCLILPLGSIIVVALPPFWDFATSGLETGLAFAWLGGCFWGLAGLYQAVRKGNRRQSEPAGRLDPPVWLAGLIGLGVLVRPDFIVFVLAFMGAFFILCRPLLSCGARLRVGAFALALPCAYQIFRMGYYGALAPNPAFTKEASAANWPQGWHYLVDIMKPYWFPLPLLLVSTLALPFLPRLRHRGFQTELLVLVAVPIAAALAHGSYVVYIGGDFMHARLLLPDLFALLLPVAVIGVDSVPMLILTLAIVAWALVCATAFRPSYTGIGPNGIADERGYYVARAQDAHPITLDDYRLYPSAVDAFAQQKQLTPGSLLTQSGAQIALRPGVPAEAAVEGLRIGIYGYIFGINVHVVDLFGLADPIAGRLELVKRGRPGHEKQLPEAWVIARVADPAAPAIAGVDSRDGSAARGALSCDGAKRLVTAVTERMTPGRFALNLLEAFRLQRLRIPPDPPTAQAKLC